MKSQRGVADEPRSTANVSVLAARRIKPATRFHLKTRQITFLVRLDEERSLVRAAARTGLTQPAASKLLREIESALDVKLFDRHARGMTPTCYGEILVRHARLALSELRAGARRNRRAQIRTVWQSRHWHGPESRDQSRTAGGRTDEAAVSGYSRVR